jgi:hypothetical protein
MATREELKRRLLEIQQAKVEKLRLMKDYKDANKIEYFNTPTLPANPLQAELFSTYTDPYYKTFTYTGSNRIGKTTTGCIVTISTMIGRYPWDGTRLPFTHNKPRKVRIIGQDWDKHISKVVIPALEEWWPKSRVVTKKKNNMGVDAFWKDEQTGSTLEIMSNNQDSDLHEGWHGDLIYYDEPPKRDIRVANARGLIDRQGRELYCMTLLKEAWVDQEVIKARNADGTPDRTVYNIQGDIWSNVGFGITKEGVDQFSKTLNEEEYSARILGKPSYLSGLVAKNFDRKVHLKRRFVIPLDWIVDIAIDIHPRKEQMILFIATSPKGDRYICNEVWEHGDGKWVGETIVRIIDRNKYRVGQVICDPLAKGDSNNDNTTFDKIDMILSNHGMYLKVACKDKQSGIIELNNHLLGPNNEPSLFIFDDLIRTVKEIEGWMYDADTQKPAKVNDDAMECLYRLLLLDTQWYPPADKDEEDDYRVKDTANQWTGY